MGFTIRPPFVVAAVSFARRHSAKTLGTFGESLSGRATNRGERFEGLPAFQEEIVRASSGVPKKRPAIVRSPKNVRKSFFSTFNVYHFYPILTY